MKKIIISLFMILILVTGCGSSDSRSEISSDKIDNSKYKTNNYSYTTCTRDAETKNKEKVTIKYEIYYDKSKYLQVLKLYQKVESSNKNILSEYQNAYKKIYSAYNDLDYYEYDISTSNNSVTSITYINYGKIDMDKLMEIEGADDNVTVTNGKIKLSDWKDFAKKYGATCK